MNNPTKVTFEKNGIFIYIDERLSPLLPLFAKYKIPSDFLDKDNREWKNEKAIKFAEAVLVKAGYSKEFAKITTHGVKGMSFVKADGEITWGQPGWGELYNCYMVQYACRAYIRKVCDKDERVEVGLKYPQFSVRRFMTKFGITPAFESITENRWKMGQEDPKDLERATVYQLYTDNKGNVFSFEKGRIGEGGYAGAIFNNEADALTFVKWLLGYKTHYLKDLDMIFNGLGGFGIRDWEWALKMRQIEADELRVEQELQGK